MATYTIETKLQSSVNVYFESKQHNGIPPIPFSSASPVRKITVFIDGREVDEIEVGKDSEYYGFFPFHMRYFTRGQNEYGLQFMHPMMFVSDGSQTCKVVFQIDGQSITHDLVERQKLNEQQERCVQEVRRLFSKFKHEGKKSH